MLDIAMLQTRATIPLSQPYGVSRVTMLLESLWVLLMLTCVEVERVLGLSIP